MIAHNRSARKELWTERGEGEPVQRPRARGRARRGALRRRRDRAARRRGRVARRDRGLLPDQRAVPRARGHAGPLRLAYQVIGGTQVLRARRDQGRARLPDAARQPGRRGRLRARRQLAAARHRRHHARARIVAPREHDRRAGLGRRRRARAVPGLGAAAVKARRPLHVDDGARCASGPRRRGVGDLLERCSAARPATLEALEAERTIEAAGPAREPRGAGRRRARVRRQPAEDGELAARGVPPADRAVLRAGRPARRRGHRHADDAPQRQGPRVPRSCS